MSTTRLEVYGALMGNRNKMFTVNFIICRLSVISVLFKFLELLLEVIFAHFVFLVAGIAALPLEYIE